MDYPPHIGSMWKLRLWLLFVAVLLIFPIRTWAANDYIVPEICVNRAIDIGVFTDKNPFYTQNALRKDFTQNRTVDYSALASQLSNTLQDLNSDLGDGKSKLNRYLSQCSVAQNELTQLDYKRVTGQIDLDGYYKEYAKHAGACHGYFIQTNDFQFSNLFRQTPKYQQPSKYHFVNSQYVNMYCDFQIYISLTQNIVHTMDRKLRPILINPVSEMVSTQDVSADIDLVDQILTGDFPEMQTIYNLYLTQSPMPEMFRYVLNKVKEEFTNIDEVKRKVAMIGVSEELMTYGSMSDTVAEKFKIASDTMKSAGSGMADHPDAGLLNLPNSPASTNMLLYRSEEEYWKNRVTSQKVLSMPTEDQISFFTFLSNHPFFYRDLKQNQFATTKTQVKNNERSFAKLEVPSSDKYFFWNPKTMRMEESDEIKAYKKQLGFKPMGTMFPSKYPDDLSPTIRRSYLEQKIALLKLSENMFMQNFIFDLQFRNDYMASLRQKLANEKTREVEDLISVQWRKIFLDYVPYTFNRDAKELIIRDLFRHTESYARKNILNSKDQFVIWAQSVMCDPQYRNNEVSYSHFNEIKSKKFSTSYCSVKNDQKRKDMFGDLFNEWKNRKIKFSKPTTNGAFYQRYLYDQDFINRLNGTIRSVNNYCWDHMDRDGFAKDPGKFQNDEELSGRLKAFYLAAGENLLSKVPFTSALRFNPSRIAKNCFSDGYGIGNELLKSEYANQLESESTGYRSTIDAKKANEAAMALSKLAYKEKFKRSEFEITKSLMEYVEKKIDATVIDDMVVTHEAVRKSKDKNAVENYMKTSVSLHTLATIDYLRDYPDPMLARYFGYLLRKENTEQRVKEEWRPFWNAIIFGGTIFAGGELLIANITKTALKTWEGLGASAFILGGAGDTLVQVITIHHENNEIDRSRATNSIDPQIEKLLKKINSDKVDGLAVEQAIQDAFILMLAGRPISIFGKYVKNFANSGFRNTIAAIKTSVERYVESTGMQNSYLLSDTFVKHLAKVSPEERTAFLQLLDERGVQYTSKVDDFLAKWSSQLSGLPSLLTANIKAGIKTFVDRAGPSVSFMLADDFVEFVATKASPEDRAAFLKMIAKSGSASILAVNNFIISKWADDLESLKSLKYQRSPLKIIADFLFQRKFFYEIKVGWYQLCRYMLGFSGNMTQLGGNVIYPDAIRAYFYDRFAMEKSMVDVLNASIDASKRLGRVIYSDDDLISIEKGFSKGGITRSLTYSENEIANIETKFKFFARDMQYDGKFYRVFAEDVKEQVNEFIERFPFLSGNKIAAEDLLERALSGYLIDRGQWVLVLKEFTGQIESVGDLKCFMEILKVANNRYTGFFAQLEHMKNLIDFREIFSGPVFYPSRANYILDHINEFYSVARSWKQLGAEDFLATITQFSQKYGVSTDEIIQNIEKLNFRSEKYDMESLLDLTTKPIERISRTSLGGDPYLVEYWDMKQQDLKKVEKELKEDLNKILADTPNKAEAFAKAYVNAKNAVRQDKKLRSGCRQFGSVIKGSVGKTYGAFLNSIAATASGTNYAIVHNDESKDEEWWVRGGFEIAAAYLTNKIFLSGIYSNGGNYSPIIRDFIFYPATVAAGITLDSTLYQAIIEGRYNGDDRYEAEFKRIIFDSEDLKKTVETFFSRHPDVEKNLKDTLMKLEKVYTFLMTQQQFGVKITDKIVEEAFLKQKLYETYFGDGQVSNPTEQQILDVMKSYLYQGVEEHDFNANNEEMYLHGDEYLFDRGTQARAGFNATYYEPRIALAALAKNGLVFSFLCKARYLPAPAAVVMALGTYSIYKTGVDIFKFNKRDQMTHH